MSGKREERLWEAIEDKNYRKASFLLKNGAQADSLLEDGTAVIHFLSGINGSDANQLLIQCLENGASPNVPSCDGITPVHVAAIWGIFDNLSTLIEYGGNVEVRDADGMSPLDYAEQSTECQSKDCLKLLTDLVRDNEGHVYTKVKSKSDSLTKCSSSANKDAGRNKASLAATNFKPQSYFLNPSGRHYMDGRDFMTDDETSTVSLDQTEDYESSFFVNNFANNAKNPRQVSKGGSKSHLPIHQYRNYYIDGRDFMTDDETSTVFLDRSEDCDPSFVTRKPAAEGCSKGHLLTQPHRSHNINGRDFMSDNEPSKVYLDQTDDYDPSFVSITTTAEGGSKYHLLTQPHRNNYIDGRDFLTEDEQSSDSLLLTSSSSRFHTANEGGMSMTFSSALDDTVISFPKLHPWTATQSKIDLDDTIIDGICGLDIRNTSESTSNNIMIDNSINSTLSDGTVLYDWKEYSILEVPPSSGESDVSLIIPESLLKMGCQELREELLKLGDDPGPIRADTRMLYVRRLARIQSGLTDGHTCDRLKEYLPEVRAIIEGRLPSPEMDTVEESMCIEFTQHNLRRKWREGTEKSSFNYLLLDPRVTQNLPVRSKKMAYEDVFHTFVAAIFYVGKGKRSRPYAHLYEAISLNKTNRKLQQIRDIWSAGLGVVSLHCFQGVIPVEAYTREACLVEALGLPRLTNQKRCDYYGRAKIWSLKKKRQMGVYLLKRALQIFLNEGERQMRPEDLKRSK